jgi:hypothetical protein
LVGGFRVEKKIVKTGVYSLVVSFLLMTVGFKKDMETVDVDGVSVVQAIAYSDFFFAIFRYSIIISMVAMYLAFFVLLIQKKTDRIVNIIKFNQRLNGNK